MNSRVVEEVEALLQALRECVGTDAAQAGRSELDGERQPVDPAYDLGDGGEVLGAEDERRIRRHRTVDEEPHRRRRRGVVADGVGRHGERLDSPDVLAGEAQHLTTGGEDRQVGTRGEQPLGESGDGGSEVLAVVEHEQRTASPEELDEGVLDGEVLALLHVDRGRDGGHRQQRVLDRRELDHVHLAAASLPDIGGDAQCEAGLADTSGTEQGDQAVTRQQADDAGEVDAPADQRGDLGRSCPSPAGRRRGRRPHQRGIGFQDLPLERPDACGRIETEFIVQDRPERGDPPEGIRGSTAAMECCRQQHPSPFAQGMLGDERLHLGHEGVVLARVEAEREPFLASDGDRLLEACDVGSGPLAFRELVEGRTGRRGQGIGEQPDRGAGFPGASGRSTLGLETPDIDGVVIDLQRVPRRPRDDAGFGFEELAKSRHVALQHRCRVGGRVDAPQLVAHPTRRHDGAPGGHEHREQQPLLGPADRHGDRVAPNLDVPEHMNVELAGHCRTVSQTTLQNACRRRPTPQAGCRSLAGWVAHGVRSGDVRRDRSLMQTEEHTP